MVTGSAQCNIPWQTIDYLWADSGMQFQLANLIFSSFCSPFFGEEYNFRVPRDFQRLTFYVCEPGLRCDSRLGKVAIAHEELLSDPTREEQWYGIRPIDADSEVQVS